MNRILLIIGCVALLGSCQKDRVKRSEISYEPIRVKNDTCYAVLPNAFTPNGDGRNDIFRPFLNGNVSSTDFEFTIRLYTKNIIFTTTDLNEGWDGADCPTGIYIATMKGTFNCGGTFNESIYVCLYTDCVRHPNIEELHFESMMSPITGESPFPSGEEICP